MQPPQQAEATASAPGIATLAALQALAQTRQLASLPLLQQALQLTAASLPPGPALQQPLPTASPRGYPVEGGDGGGGRSSGGGGQDSGNNSSGRTGQEEQLPMAMDAATASAKGVAGLKVGTLLPSRWRRGTFEMGGHSAGLWGALVWPLMCPPPLVGPPPCSCSCPSLATTSEEWCTWISRCGQVQAGAGGGR